MTGPAVDIVDVDAGIPLADGDAVVSRSDVGTRDGDVVAHLQVDSVGVGTGGRRGDCYSGSMEALAAHERDVEELAVQRRYPLHPSVRRRHEFNRLKPPSNTSRDQ